MKKFVILFYIFIVLLPITVNASTVNLVSNRYDDMYSYYYDRNLDRMRYLEASMYSFNGKVAYCLEIGTYISSTFYNVVDNFDMFNIDSGILEYIKKASYYGYDYPGHHTDRFYLATQEIIWNALIGTDIKFTNGFNPDDYLDLSYEKSMIYSLIAMHNAKPSFDGATIDYTLGDTMTITDENGSLYMYNVTTPGVYIDGNSLVITSEFRGGDIVLERPNYNNESFLVYTSGASQKMMSTGSIDLQNSVLRVNSIGGFISIDKVDSVTQSHISRGEATLDGAIYALYDADYNYIDEYVTGSKQIIENLPIGRYYIREIVPSVGYNCDNTTYAMDITKDSLYNHITFDENIIERRIDLFKVFASDTTGIMTTESGIIFEIYHDGELIDSIVTDNDGYASIILPYGTYIFRQVNTTDGFYKTDDFIVTVDSSDDRPIYKLISDSEIKAKVKIIKKDYDTNENIINSNVKFRIFDRRKNEFVSFNLTYPNEVTISTFYVNDDGYLITPDYLPYGEYTLYEVDDVINGYTYNVNGLDFTIDNNSNFVNENGDTILELSFYNRRVKGKIVVNKYGEDIIYKDNMYYYKDVFLSDVYFELYAKEDIYENGLLIYEKDKLVKKCITDDGGICDFDNLPLGKYYLVETKSSGNNEIDNNIYDIELKYKDQYTNKIVYEIDVFNYLKKGTLVINKYDSKDNARLKNTLVEIRNIDNVVIYKGYTNDNGQIIIDDLLYGEYYLSEVEASSGYRLLEDNVYFTLDKDEISIDLYNDKEEVPNTGMDIGILNIIVIITILFCLIFMYTFWHIKLARFCFSIIGFIGILYLVHYFYVSITDNKKNEMAINDFMNNSINYNSYDERYNYEAVLEIPSIGVKRGIVGLNNNYNDVKYNIMLVRKKDNDFVLAAHNGNYYNSYFGNLKNMELSDHIKYYYNNKVFDYVFSDRYVVNKKDNISIYCPGDKNCIHLITCLEGNDNAQIVYVGYLDSVLDLE